MPITSAREGSLQPCGINVQRDYEGLAAAINGIKKDRKGNE
jgi:hypothetical protein